MKFVLLISGENEALAFSEIKSVAEIFDPAVQITRKWRLIFLSSALICEKEAAEIQARLAFTKSTGLLLFSCSRKLLNKKIETFDWASVYSSSFSVRIRGISEKESRIALLERRIGGKIFDLLQAKGVKPRVNLEFPKTKIEFFFLGNTAFCAKIIAVQKEDFDARAPRYRPGFSPVSMSPKLCRCIVNLSGATGEETVFDPFCGTGGILIEAGLMGLKIEGSDIDSEMAEKCRKNLKFSRIFGKVSVADASRIPGIKDYVVCDLPYGVSSYLSEKKKFLYPKFARALSSFLGKRAVLCIKKGPDKQLIRKNLKGLFIRESFNYYIHKSMTKKIIVIERGKWRRKTKNRR
ncbi:MAG: THUMP domain-containing protein [Candidatus Woesearchaeota archaeon]|nr:THUMP domain-containing protein [Candidatus Woesearchaeota archaeon]